jgi:hypothetical protein
MHLESQVKSYGLRLAVESLSTGNHERFNAVMLEAGKRLETAMALTAGAVAGMRQMIARCESAGYRLQPAPPSEDEIAFALAVGGKAEVDIYGRLFSGVVALKRAIPGISWSVEVPRCTARTDPAKPAGPIEVRVVAMPDRKTTTVVDRDPKTGRVVSAEQLQTDA